MLAGEVDAAIISIGAATPAGLATHVVTEQSIVAAVSHAHELANRDVIALLDIRDQPLISLPHGTGLRARLDKAAAAVGIRLHITFEASAPEVLADLAAHQLGVAFLPGQFAKFRADRLKVLRIDPPRLRGRLVFAWRAVGRQARQGGP